MKKSILLLLIMSILIIVTACTKENSTSAFSSASDSDGMQFAFDMSVKAEEYTEKLFKKMIENQGITEYEIKQTNGGFITDDPLIFIVGYRYGYGNFEEVYGYKLKMNDDQTFSVIEEGVSVGEFIMY